MEGCQSSETVVYGQKEYTEIVLNGDSESSTDDEPVRNKPNTVSVSSLDDDKLEEETWPFSCQEKEILKTTYRSSLYEKYVSKTILSTGQIGSRPHFQACCSFVIEKLVLLDSTFSQILLGSPVFANHRTNIETNLKIGYSDTEIERALELALMHMFEGESSEIILNASKRIGKTRDQEIEPVACLKFVLTLRKITNLTETSDMPLNYNFLLPHHFGRSKEEKYKFALDEKTHGIQLFKRERYVDAFHRFAAGFKVLITLDCFLCEKETDDAVDDVIKEEEMDDKDILSLYSTLCSNMAECQLKENNPTHAISLCKRALAVDPCSVKALFRQASAAWILGDVDQADSVLKRLFELDPNNTAAKQLNSKVQVKIKRYEDEYTKIMKRIFSK